MNPLRLIVILFLLSFSLTSCDSVDDRIAIRFVLISIAGLIAAAVTKKKNNKIIEEDARLIEDFNKIKNTENQEESPEATESENTEANASTPHIKHHADNTDTADVKPTNSTLFGTYTYTKSGCLTMLFAGIFLLVLSFWVGTEESSIFAFLLVLGLSFIIIWVVMELVYYFKKSKNFVYLLYMDRIEFYSEPGVLVYVLNIGDISNFTIEFEKTRSRYGEDKISKEIFVFTSQKNKEVYKILITLLSDKENGMSFKEGFQCVLSLYKNRTN